jgi:hypothetical protein
VVAPAPPPLDVNTLRDAILALEGTVLEDFQLPLPGDLKDISKAAPLVSGTIENRIPEMLNRVRNTTWDPGQAYIAYEWRKSPIGFPDLLLVDRADPEQVIFEIEAKSWYVLSTDALTARFLTDPSVITAGTLVVVVAWILDEVVAGSPKLLRIHVDDAARLAEVRDDKWTSGRVDRRIVRPSNSPHTPRSLFSTQVRGEYLRNGQWQAEAQNFGKLDRLGDPRLQQFKKDTLSLKAAGKSYGDWRNFVTQ